MWETLMCSLNPIFHTWSQLVYRDGLNSLPIHVHALCKVTLLFPPIKKPLCPLTLDRTCDFFDQQNLLEVILYDFFSLGLKRPCFPEAVGGRCPN